MFPGDSSSLSQRCVPPTARGRITIYSVGASSIEEAIPREESIDMKRFLVRALQNDDLRLRAVPDLLAISVPQFIEDGGSDGARE